jgi:hypothetical protein
MSIINPTSRDLGSNPGQQGGSRWLMPELRYGHYLTHISYSWVSPAACGVASLRDPVDAGPPRPRAATPLHRRPAHRRARADRPPTLGCLVRCSGAGFDFSSRWKLWLSWLSRRPHRPGPLKPAAAPIRRCWWDCNTSSPPLRRSSTLPRNLRLTGHRGQA